MAKKEKRPKKIIFSEEVDSAINGFAVGILFIGIGLFLMLKPDYFAEPVASYIIGAVIGLLGVMGTGVELSKSTKIKGLDMLSVGATMFVCWLVQYVYIHALWANIAFFPLLVIGAYGILLGLFRTIYSIFENSKHRPSKDGDKANGISIGKLVSQIVLFLTQLCGLAVAVLNVLKASGI